MLLSEVNRYSFNIYGMFENFQDKQIPVTVHELLIGISRFYYFMSIFYICILPKKGTFFAKAALTTQLFGIYDRYFIL